MRLTLLTTAVALALAASPQVHAADSAELAELKQQLAELQARLVELETRTEAQSDVNIDTATALDKITTGSPKVVSMSNSSPRHGVAVTPSRGTSSSSSRMCA